MFTFATRAALALVLFAIAGAAVADKALSPKRTGTVQIIKVSGSDLTGLNRHTLTSLINQARQKGSTKIVVDLGSVTHMTPAGMESLTAGAHSFGSGNFAIANLSGQPARLAQSEGAGLFAAYTSVQEAVSALKE